MRRTALVAALRTRLTTWRRALLTRGGSPATHEGWRRPHTILVTGAAGAVATLIQPLLAQA